MSQNGGQNSRNHNNFQKYANNGAYCTYCCRPGHMKSNCYKLKKNQTVSVVQVTMAVKENEFLILMMLHSQQSP
jgi:diaminopimelate decarboxylase